LEAAFVPVGTYDPGINASAVIDLAGLVLPSSPLSYRNYIRSSSNIDHSFAPTFTAKDVSNEEVPMEIIRDFEANGSTVPIFTNPKCFVEGDYLIVLADGYSTFVSVLAVVIRQPKALALTTASPTTETITCELPSQIHQVIVNTAVQLYQSTINANDAKR